jgi:tetratricopeptide (TPR) repeat protein
MIRFVLGLVFAAAALAVPNAQIVSERDQHDALQHYRAGEDALHGERFEAAESEFRQAIKLDPLLHFAHYGLGRVYMFTRRYPLAVLAFSDAREAFLSAASQSLESDVERQRQIDEQIRVLEQVKRTLDPNERSPGPRPKLVDPNAALQTINDQITQLRAQSHRNADKPADVPAWLSLALGSAYFRSDKIVEAEHEYRESVRVDPKIGEAHNNLAVVLMLTRRYDEAEAEMKEAERRGFNVNPQFKSDLKERRRADGQSR